MVPLPRPSRQFLSERKTYGIEHHGVRYEVRWDGRNRVSRCDLVTPSRNATRTAGWVQSLTDILYIRLASDPALDVEDELATMRDVIAGFLRLTA